MIDNLSEDIFFSYAMKNYNNPFCIDVLEFNEDLNRIKYIKRLFNRYEKGGELKERHIINHLVILYNVFITRACTSMLIYKLNDYLPYLKPFLMYLGYWNDNEIAVIGDRAYLLKEVILDQGIVNRLREMERERKNG